MLQPRKINKGTSGSWTTADISFIMTAGKVGLWGVCGAIGVFSLANALSAPDWTVFFKAVLKGLSVGLSVSMAAGLIGASVGFLFGIPKVLQNRGEATSVGLERNRSSVENAPTEFLTNTSLEEISDWLTKIIIGLGLVQFNSIIGYIKTASQYSVLFIERQRLYQEPWQAAMEQSESSAFFFSLIIICLLGACLFAYLQTRTHVTLMFMKIENIKVSGLDLNIASSAPITVEVANPADPMGGTKAAPGEATDADKALLSVKRSQLHSAAEIAAWAAAQARAGNVREASYALRDALQLDPGNADTMLKLAEVSRLLQDRKAFVDITMELIRKAPRVDSLVSLARAAQLEALYLPPPDGFTKAIKISEFLDQAGAADKPSVQLRRACAFGQKYSHSYRFDSQAASTAREQALTAARNVVLLEPNPDAAVRKTLRQILDPAAFNGPIADNDLAVFADDEAFRSVIIEGRLE